MAESGLILVNKGLILYFTNKICIRKYYSEQYPWTLISSDHQRQTYPYFHGWKFKLNCLFVRSELRNPWTDFPQVLIGGLGRATGMLLVWFWILSWVCRVLSGKIAKIVVYDKGRYRCHVIQVTSILHCYWWKFWWRNTNVLQNKN